MISNNIIKRSLFLILLSIIIINAHAQTGLNFQGVARATNNVILASQAITIKLSILQGSTTGTADYVETRKVMTNAQGLFTAVIGDTGAISTLGNFTTINWKLSPKFLKIEMDAAAGTNFITMGTTQFQYVAYAQFAKSVDAENIVGIVPVSSGGTGVSSIAGLKTALTLNNVNNTTDLTKPISTLTQTALDLKLNAADTSKYTKQTYADSALLTKLKISDTIAMLSSRIARDTLSLSNRINLKAKTTDLTSGLDLKLNAADTIKYTKQTYSDSALLTKLKISDTTAMMSSRIARDTLSLSNRIDLKGNAADITSGLALKENISNKSTAVDLGGTSPSDILFPTQKAVKDYVAANNSGGGVADGGITTIKLADGAVIDAKINTVNGSKVIGNITGNAATATLATTATTATTAGNITATSNTTLTSLSNLATVGTIISGVWSGTAVAIEKGGTGATTASAARTNLGLAVGSDVLAYRTFGTAANNNTADFEVPLTFTSPLSRVTNTISIPAATTSVNGYLSSADWATFNAKQTALIAGSGISISAGTISATGLTTSNLSSAAGITNAQLAGSIAASKLVGTDITTVGTLIAGAVPYSLLTGTVPTFNQNTTGNAATATTATTAGTATTTTGNAGTATKLATARTINGVAFDGSGNIDITASADAGTLTGTTLNATVTGSSLTSVGTLANLTVTNPISGSITGNAATATLATNATTAGNITATANTTLTSLSNLATVGTLIAGAVPYSLLTGTAPTFNQNTTGNAATATTATTAGTATTTTGNAGTATKLATARTINGIAFDGSANIDITASADAGTLTGTTLNATVTGSSLTSVGTIASLTTGAITNSGKVIVGASSAASASAVLEASSTTQGFLPPRLNYYQKTQITSPVAGLTIWCSNCGASGEMQVFNGGEWTNMSGGTATATISLNIGDSYQGGKVAYVLISGDPGYDANTPHGLIAATSDQSTGIRWYNGSYSATGATGTEIGTGLSNTNTIITSQGASTSYAAGLARAYKGGGYTDWYLPSNDELAKLYAMKVRGFGGFSNNYYWSSTEYNSFAYAGIQDFFDGNQGFNYKDIPRSVRAIRAF